MSTAINSLNPKPCSLWNGQNLKGRMCDLKTNYLKKNRGWSTDRSSHVRYKACFGIIPQPNHNSFGWWHVILNLSYNMYCNLMLLLIRCFWNQEQWFSTVLMAFSIFLFWSLMVAKATSCGTDKLLMFN